MLERMAIVESIYEGVVEPSYKKSIRADVNRAGHCRQMRVESDLSPTYSEMSKSAGKHKQRYVGPSVG